MVLVNFGKKGISNNTFAFLLIVVLIFSLSVTLSSLSKTDSLSQITGAVTGTAQANVTSSLTISLTTSTVNFGNLAVSTTDDTVDNAPPPFKIQNDGNVGINVTVNATNPFIGPSINATNFAGKCGTGQQPCGAGDWVPTTFANGAINQTSQVNRTHIAHLGFIDSIDDVELDIQVKVPDDESGGTKSTTIEFTSRLNQTA